MRAKSLRRCFSLGLMGLALAACSSGDTKPVPGDVRGEVSEPRSDARSTDAEPGDVASVDTAPADTSLVDAGDSGGVRAGPVASNFSVVVNRDVDPDPAPIADVYLDAIYSTGAGDHIVTLQKYFHSESVTAALLDAARRGVNVDAVFMEDVEPSCSSLLVPGDDIDCDGMFQRAPTCHNKNMMILRADGTLYGIVGSFNLRERSSSSPRTHTVLTFEVADGEAVFTWYQGVAERLLGAASSHSQPIVVPTDTGGKLILTATPSESVPVLEMLEGIESCDGIVWMSYYSAVDDGVGGAVFDELARLVDVGCDVRVMIDDGVPEALEALQGRGVPARFPDFSGGNATLGHKIVLVDSEGETHLIQSSANLSFYDGLMGNLTAYLRAPTMLEIRAAYETELLRYW